MILCLVLSICSTRTCWKCISDFANLVSMQMKQIEVVAAIIHDKQNRIFATQRGYGEWKDYWEFPGGKMEPGETPEEALKREIWEERMRYDSMENVKKVTVPFFT